MVQVGKRVDLFKRWWTFRITCCDQVKTASLGLLFWPSWQQLSENPLHHCQKALTAHQTPERGWNQIRSSWNKCPVPSCVTDSTKKNIPRKTILLHFYISVLLKCCRHGMRHHKILQSKALLWTPHKLAWCWCKTAISSIFNKIGLLRAKANPLQIDKSRRYLHQSKTVTLVSTPWRFNAWICIL